MSLKISVANLRPGRVAALAAMGWSSMRSYGFSELSDSNHRLLTVLNRDVPFVLLVHLVDDALRWQNAAVR